MHAHLLLHRFFTVGVKYRAPMFVATSLDAQTALRFCQRATAPPVMWTVSLPPTCAHVNYLVNSDVAGEGVHCLQK